MSVACAGSVSEGIASVSGRDADTAASLLSWSCSASLGAGSKLTVQDADGHSLLSCSFAEGRLVSYTSDFFETVPGRARPPPERWRAALEVQSASVEVYSSVPDQPDPVHWQLCTAKHFSAGVGSSFRNASAAPRAPFQCKSTLEEKETYDFSKQAGVFILLMGRG